MNTGKDPSRLILKQNRLLGLDAGQTRSLAGAFDGVFNQALQFAG